MGKGDKRSRRGKIFAGSFGKTRPKRKGRTVAVKSEPKAAPKAKKASKKSS
jgi:30S ribosomal protein S31